MADDFVVASKLGERLDGPRLSDAELERSVREIVAGIARANRREPGSERAMLKCRWAALLARAARRTPAALAPLAELLDDTDAYDAGGYDPWWESVAEQARDALAELGQPAVSELIRALGRDSPRARAHAALALERIGPVARAARGSLEKAARDPDEALRVAAASALGAVIDDEQQRLALVLDWLSEERSRQAALVVAWKLAEREPLLDRLCELLADPDPAVRRLAAHHVRLLHGAADGATGRLLECFERETHRAVRLELLEALEEVGTADPRSAQALFAAVMQSDAKLAYRALLALAKRQPSLLLPFVAPMLRRFEDRADDLGSEIAIFFQGLGETAPPEVARALAARLDELGPGDERACNLILFALESMGHAASSAVEAVERATRHEHSSVRDHAKSALARLLG